MVGSFAKDTITVIRPAEREVRGTTVFDWNNAVEHTETNCSFQPAGTSLTMDGRVLGITDGATCYCPDTADILEGDRIRFNGKTYTINGSPRRWTSPSGLRSSILLNLEEWSG